MRLVLSLLFCLCVHLSANQNAQESENSLISHVKQSIENAEKGISKLSNDVLSIEGMSSPHIRRFLNNLCSLNGARYLEIGCLKGSTLVSALYGNQGTLSDAVAIDNWSEFQWSRDIFLHNVHTHLPQCPVRIFETDCFSLDIAQAFHQPVNIYFYDGGHSETAHKEAFTYFDPILDDLFVAVVDDWNWEHVRQGTLSAFRELNYEILFERTFYTPYNCDHHSWWNGLYIAVIKHRP